MGVVPVDGNGRLSMLKPTRGEEFEKLVSGPRTRSTCDVFNIGNCMILTIISPTDPAGAVYVQSRSFSQT